MEAVMGRESIKNDNENVENAHQRRFPAFAGAASRRQVGLLSCSRTHLYATRTNSGRPYGMWQAIPRLARRDFLNIPSC